MAKIKGLLIITFSGLFLSNAFALKQDRMIQEIEQEMKQEQSPEANLVARPIVEYDVEGLRDPFKGYEKEKTSVDGKEGAPAQKAQPVFIVNGIIAGGPAPLAIINNKVMRQGDVIEEAKVIKIEKEGVEMLFEGVVTRLPSPLENSLSKLNLMIGEKDEKKP
ncbi:MAG: hypothetical protein WC628_03255 [Candidatus Omnitrophota bacterium]